MNHDLKHVLKAFSTIGSHNFTYNTIFQTHWILTFSAEDERPANFQFSVMEQLVGGTFGGSPLRAGLH